MELPLKLAELVDDFAALEPSDRLQLLMELADELPELPPHYVEHPELMERVPECQTPLLLAVEVATEVDSQAPRVRLHFDAPPQAPTTRGFAAILHAGLDGERPSEVLSVPDDFYTALGLGEIVSLLRLRGMASMLGRIKRQVAAHAPS